ncbi:MAG: FMN-dependent NADH-azoreductase [Chitinophagaceae bacterium]|nr:MAG: FMN-dependent NADH-azoreductase [Chitinophagaceae bacterium]
MKNILHIISSPRGEGSYSIKLGKAVVDKLLQKYPDASVKEYNLVDQKFPHLEEAHITSFFTPAEKRTPENIEAIHHSDEAIAMIEDADIIVMGAPMYNFTIHSSLKAWLDHVIRAGRTFYYDEKGVHGLLGHKKIYLAVSSGNIYSEGPAATMDHVVPYLKDTLGFIGLKDITVFRIEGTSLPGQQESAVTKGLESISLN